MKYELHNILFIVQFISLMINIKSTRNTKSSGVTELVRNA